MAIDFDSIYQVTLDHYRIARDNLFIANESYIRHDSEAISDVIPGFKADKLEFGSYAKENYAVLFVDMRNSTKRAQDVGAQKTFLTMHVFLTALLEVVKYYRGKVIDIMGDGLMVFWGGKEAREKENMTNKYNNLFKEAVLSIRSAQNMIVVKTIIGSANSAAAFIDNLNITEIIGTLAGDDTVFVVVVDEYSAEMVKRKLNSYLQ